MKFAVIQFPGSNCDQDCLRAVNSIEGLRGEYVWHKQTSLQGFDAVVLPGGFSYGDYLRCGAIARFSPIMSAVTKAAREGTFIMGTCNGFQVLCEQQFICEMASCRVEVSDSPFTLNIPQGTILRLPIAHGEGRYFAEPKTLEELNRNRQVILRYADSNPNGSMESIAGICNPERNVFGLMPHPDRACDVRLGSGDGRLIFEAMALAITRRGCRAA